MRDWFTNAGLLAVYGLAFGGGIDVLYHLGSGRGRVLYDFIGSPQALTATALALALATYGLFRSANHLAKGSTASLELTREQLAIACGQLELVDRCVHLVEDQLNITRDQLEQTARRSQGESNALLVDENLSLRIERDASFGADGGVVWFSFIGRLRNLGLGPAVETALVVAKKDHPAQSVAVGAVNSLSVKELSGHEARIPITIYTTGMSGIDGTTVQVAYKNTFGAAGHIDYVVRWYDEPNLKDGGYYKTWKLRSKQPPYKSLDEQRRDEQHATQAPNRDLAPIKSS
jgi:hypothetical protein